MQRRVAGPMSVLVLMFMVVVDVLATCGGGGGGGTGGMGGGAMGSEVVYQVPWKMVNVTDAPTAGGLVVYWFPASENELKNSSLRNSRLLSLYAGQCVTMGVADAATALGPRFVGDEKLPVAVLASSDGKIIGKAQGEAGKLKVGQVEKLLEGEMKQREASLKQAMTAAKDAAKRGDKDAAIAQYKSVLDQKCLFPKQGKDAANELKKLGVAGVPPVPDAPNFDRALGAQIEKAMKDGLMAENMENYPAAEKLYTKARRLDPADPAPLRYLGELYRHQTGDWDKARVTFEAILAMPADPLSRAVAMHGLGKMTIHDGEFLKGLHLMEDSAKVFPLALTYRNLAVYWHSEGDRVKADAYTKQALALDPAEPFNVVFAAAFLAGNGGLHGEEALKVAAANEGLMCASYNLAAIHAQMGNKTKALALLKRHFFEYEKYDAVRSKEMMEARVDAVFASILKDPEFLAMTAGADGKLPMPKDRH
jgi:tetratricopeptide (TPR) repeat protein